jgi:hypothetical protein
MYFKIKITINTSLNIFHKETLISKFQISLFIKGKGKPKTHFKFRKKKQISLFTKKKTRKLKSHFKFRQKVWRKTMKKNVTLILKILQKKQGNLKVILNLDKKFGEKQ